MAIVTDKNNEQDNADEEYNIEDISVESDSSGGYTGREERSAYTDNLIENQARLSGRKVAQQAAKKAAKAATKTATRAAISAIGTILAYIGPWLLGAFIVIILVVVIMIALCKVPVANNFLPYCDYLGIDSIDVGA